MSAKKYAYLPSFSQSSYAAGSFVTLASLVTLAVLTTNSLKPAVTTSPPLVSVYVVRRGTSQTHHASPFEV